MHSGKIFLLLLYFCLGLERRHDSELYIHVPSGPTEQVEGQVNIDDVSTNGDLPGLSIAGDNHLIDFGFNRISSVTVLHRLIVGDGFQFVRDFLQPLGVFHRIGDVWGIGQARDATDFRRDGTEFVRFA